MVSADLRPVESERKPDEPDRAPRWFTPELAMKKLAQHRQEANWAREHERVIPEALARLSQTSPGDQNRWGK